MFSIDFEKGQEYARLQHNEPWTYLSKLERNEPIQVYGSDGIHNALYLGIVPKNRKYPLIIKHGKTCYRIPEYHVHLPDDYQRAIDQYKAALENRMAKREFAGLPIWQTILLRKSNDSLPEELCSVVDVPTGSTVGCSIQNGTHPYVDICLDHGLARRFHKKETAPTQE